MSTALPINNLDRNYQVPNDNIAYTTTTYRTIEFDPITGNDVFVDFRSDTSLFATELRSEDASADTMLRTL